MKKIVFTLKSGKCIAQTVDEKMADRILADFENHLNGKGDGHISISKPERKERTYILMSEIAAIQEEPSHKRV